MKKILSGIITLIIVVIVILNPFRSDKPEPVTPESQETNSLVVAFEKEEIPDNCFVRNFASDSVDEYCYVCALTKEEAKEEEIPASFTVNDYEIMVIVEEESYSSCDEVAAYLYYFEELPINYITKTKAKKLGWVAEKGNLWDVTDHMSIGGGGFNNNEGILPDGTKYYECDIDYNGGTRNGLRIVYSQDGAIYYSSDHYRNFILIYE